MDVSYNLTSDEKQAIDNLITSWLELMQMRELESLEHNSRVSEMALQLAIKLDLDKETQEKVFYGARLHDIGKIGIPESILLKNGPLTQDEVFIVQQHPLLAFKMLADNKFLSKYVAIPLGHHERWDGQGYPNGKKGMEIPIEAQLFSVVDAWDVMTNDQPYRKSLSKEQAADFLRSGKGSQFSAKIVDVFLELIQNILPESSHPSQILVVDDEPNLLLGLSSLLEGEGYNVITASNGKDGLAKITEKEPDLILCDIMMPRMNGFEFRQALNRVSDTAADIPFIFLTARTSIEDKKTGYALKADDYICKPFIPEELVEKVKAVLRRKETIQKKAQVSFSKKVTHMQQLISHNATHELKSPLGVIIGNLDVALRFMESEPENKILPFLKDARTSATHLNRVIDNIIYLYQLDHNPEPEPLTRINASAFLQQMILEAAKTWETKGVNVSTRMTEEVFLYAPVSGLSLAVYHLLDNAFKFASKNGHVQVTLERNGDQIQMTFENDGQKIPSEKRKDIFDRFMQVSEGDARNFGGLGLGLAIVKAFAQSVRGTVNAEESQIGTLMRLTFPFIEDPDRERLKQKLEMYF